MRVIGTAALAVSVLAMPSAQRAPRTSTAAACAANLGTGLKSKRTFCDVLIGTRPADSIAVSIPRHTGTATLQFDLHNRFTVPAIVVPGALTFARHEATVGIVRQTGQVISRAAVLREFRALTDLFDQIGGGGRPGGVIAVAPGPPEAVRITVPAGVSDVGIVGLRLKVMTRALDDVYDTPGRPVAIVSNIRVQYRPAP
jgi:hypothetical protein